MAIAMIGGPPANMKTKKVGIMRQSRADACSSVELRPNQDRYRDNSADYQASKPDFTEQRFRHERSIAQAAPRFHGVRIQTETLPTFATAQTLFTMGQTGGAYNLDRFFS